jgi:hypothetical protein
MCLVDMPWAGVCCCVTVSCTFSNAQLRPSCSCCAKLSADTIAAVTHFWAALRCCAALCLLCTLQLYAKGWREFKGAMAVIEATRLAGLLPPEVLHWLQKDTQVGRQASVCPLVGVF